MYKKLLILIAVFTLLLVACAPAATTGEELSMVFLPKNLGNAVFDEAHEGALKAAEELGVTEELQYLAPASGAAGTEQIPIITNATSQGVDAIMISNNAGDQIAHAAQDARDAGITVVRDRPMGSLGLVSTPFIRSRISSGWSTRFAGSRRSRPRPSGPRP